MFELVIILLDLIFMSLIASNTPTFLDFLLVTFFATTASLSTMARWQPRPQVAPAYILAAFIFCWLWVHFTWYFGGWIVHCICNLRFPTSSEMMLIATRTIIHLAFRPIVVEILQSTTWIRLHPDQEVTVANTIAATCARALSVPYTCADLMYVALELVLVLGQILGVGV